MKGYFILAVLLILFDAVKPFDIQTTISDGTGDSNIELKEPFTKIGENYYIIKSNLKKTWLGAVNYCTTKGARLTSIETEDEWQALSSYLLSKGYNESFWIGANDIDTTFKFFWISSGLPMLYTNWYPGEPNNAEDNEKCVHLRYYRNNIEYLMNDWGCHKEEYFICAAQNPKTVFVTVW